MRLVPFLLKRMEHRRNERRDRAWIERQQLKKFHRLATHARLHSPYYREIIEREGIDIARCRPQDFPVLTKSALVAHFDDIVTDRRVTRADLTAFLQRSHDPQELFLGDYYVLHSSGSSGEQGYFIYSRAEWSRSLAHIPRIHSMRPGRRIAYVGAAGGHYAGVSIMSSGEGRIPRRILDVSVCDINDALSDIVARLNKIQPHLLVGYGNALRRLAEQSLLGSLRIAPSLVENSGESVSDDDRRLIESGFGVPLLNVYASSEFLFMGCAKPEWNGMYLFEDDLIYEIHDDHTCVTGLFNFTLPLIRYRLSDVLLPMRDNDGRYPFTKVRQLVGRMEHAPEFLNEDGERDFISPHVIGEFFVPGVRRFQMRIGEAQSFVFAVCLDGGHDGAGAEQVLKAVDAGLRAVLRRKRMGNVRFEIKVVDDIPVDAATGKFRLIVRPAVGERMPGGDAPGAAAS